MKVNSMQNKELLFELLSSVIQENGFLVDITTLEKLIDEQCDNFETKKQNFNDLSEINKIILDNCYKFLLETQLKQTAGISVVNDNDLFKKDNMDTNFKIAKKNFETMISLKKPEEINFEDIVEEEMPPENLETIMNQTLADRQRELENITQKYSNSNIKKAEDWINQDKPKNEKKVTFQEDVLEINNEETFDEPLENFNIFSKLKKKSPPPPSNEDQIKINKKNIKILLENQEKLLFQQKTVIEILNKITEKLEI